MLKFVLHLVRDAVSSRLILAIILVTAGLAPVPAMSSIQGDVAQSSEPDPPALVAAGANPQESRVAHLSSDSVSARQDYIVRTGKLSATDLRTLVQAWQPPDTSFPQGRLLFSHITDSTRPFQNLVDVVDLDGDTNAEIVGFYPGDVCANPPVSPALYVLNGDGSTRLFYTTFPAKTDLGIGSVRVYSKLGTNLKRIVVAPNTFNMACMPDYANSSSSSAVNVYFWEFPAVFNNPNPIGGAGVSLLTPLPSIQGNGPTPTGREILTFPGICIGRIQSTDTKNTVVVVAKSRLITFNEDGAVLSRRQFIDPSHGFTDYNTTLDMPPPATISLEGRRYGLYKLADCTGDGRLDIIMAGDANSLTVKAAYEAYTVPTSGDGYWGGNNRIFSVYIPDSTIGLTPSSYPTGYNLGVPQNGIVDITGDGVPEILFTSLAQVSGAKPSIQYINTANGVVTSLGINGVLLDAVRLAQTVTSKDLIVFHLNNDPMLPGDHRVFRRQMDGSYLRLQESPTGNLSSDSAAGLLIRRTVGNDYTLPEIDGEDNVDHFAVATTKSGGVTAFLGQNSDGCPSSGTMALRSWTAGATIQRSLDMAQRPGRYVNILQVSDPDNFVFLLQIERTCLDGAAGVSKQLTAFVQSLKKLVPNGDLGGYARTVTCGVYVPSTATYFLKNSNASGGADLSFVFGPTGLVPLVGDWNGDGIDTIGAYLPSSNSFFLNNENVGGAADYAFNFGASASFVPIAGDWDGDGNVTVGLYDPATAAFFLRNSNSAGAADLVFVFGAAGVGWVPIVGDWNGDGVDTIGAYVPSTGTFFLRNQNSAGSADLAFTFGAPNQTPLTGDWNGDGTDTIGTYVPSSQAWFLRNSNSSGSADLSFVYGPSGSTPIGGNWDGL